MAAPVPGAKGIPAGARLRDGFRTTIAFAIAPTASIWEVGVKPPGRDGGDPVQTSTMLNNAYHTFGARYLVKTDPMTGTFAYDPVVYNTMIGILNFETTITVTFPDGSTVAMYGWLSKFEPTELKEGEFPTASCTIVSSCTDPNTGEEEPPVYTAGALTFSELKRRYRRSRNGNGQATVVAAQPQE